MAPTYGGGLITPVKRRQIVSKKRRRQGHRGRSLSERLFAHTAYLRSCGRDDEEYHYGLSGTCRRCRALGQISVVRGVENYPTSYMVAIVAIIIAVVLVLLV